MAERAVFLPSVRSGHRPVTAEHHSRVVRLLLRRVMLLMVRGLLHVWRVGGGCGVMMLGQRRPDDQMLLRWLLMLLLLLLLTRRFFVVVVTQ